MNNQTAYVTVQLSKEFRRLLNKQLRSNRTFSTLAVIGAVCGIWSAVERRKQDETIYQLNVRLKKLERSEGE